MMEMKKHLKRNRSGSVLALAAIMVVILSAIGLGLIKLGLGARMQAGRTTSQIGARSAADSGLIQAIRLMNIKLDAETTWSDGTLPTIADISLANSYETYSINVTGDSGSGFEIISTGKSGTAERKVHGALRLKGLFEYAIFTEQGMELKNGTTVDWYNYDADDENLQIGTNSTDAGAIDTKSGVTIDGDVVVGVGGDPDVVINSQTEATITGDTYTMNEEQELVSITVPTALQMLPSQGTIANTTTISSDAKYDSISLLGGTDIITVDGDVSIYVTGDIRLGNSDVLRIVDANTNPNASLTVYVGGNILTDQGSVLNNLTMDAGKFTIYGLDTCTSIEFKQGGTFYGTIYAPNADIHLFNGVEVYGAVVGNSFRQDVSADFHYDASLRDVSINDNNVRFAISRWWEE